MNICYVILLLYSINISISVFSTKTLDIPDSLHNVQYRNITEMRCHRYFWCHRADVYWNINQSGYRYFHTLESFATKMVPSRDTRCWLHEVCSATLLGLISQDATKGLPHEQTNEQWWSGRYTASQSTSQYKWIKIFCHNWKPQSMFVNHVFTTTYKLADGCSSSNHHVAYNGQWTSLSVRHERCQLPWTGRGSCWRV